MVGPLVAGRLLNADILYQAAALDAAGVELERVVATAAEPDAKVAALARLTEIACDRGDHVRAEGFIAEATGLATEARSPEAAGELTFARARYAFSRRDGAALLAGARLLFDDAQRAHDDPRRWSLAARSNAYAAVDLYNRRDPAGAQLACKSAWLAVQRCPLVLPFVKTHVLTTRAVVDVLDPERVHLAVQENVEAYQLSLRHGMVTTACDAMFNVLHFWLDCDEPGSANIFGPTRELLSDATRHALGNDDPMVAAMAAAFVGRYDEAIAHLEHASINDVEPTSDWIPAFFWPATVTRRARILFKAARYVEAERTAAVAVKAWAKSGLGGDGIALRVHAEALEQLGQPRAAASAIEEALGALAPLRAVAHLRAANALAFRLTRRRAYRDEAERFSSALHKRTPIGWDALTARERQVARFVAEGLADKTIAERLGISRRTVSNHVGSVFARLGIRARWQLTADMIDPLRSSAP